MRKLAIGAIVVLALAAGAITAIWFTGKGRAETLLADQIAQLDAAGWTTSIGEQQFGGFPFRHEVRLTDLGLVRREDGLLIRVPGLTASTPATAGETTITLDGTVGIDLPTTQTMLLRDPSLPRVLKARVEHAGALVTIAHSEAPASPVTAEAARVEVRIDQEDWHGKLGLAIEGVGLSGAPEGSALFVTLGAGRLRMTADLREPGAPPASFLLDIEEIDLTSSLSGPAIAAGSGLDLALDLASVTYAAGATGLHLDLDESQFGGFKGRVAARSGPATGAFLVEDGVASLEATAETAVWTVTPDSPEGSPAGSPLGTVTIGRGSLRQTLPIRAGDAAAPGALKLWLESVTADDAFWAGIDPGGALDRTPAELALETVLTLKIADPGPGPGPLLNYRLTNMTLERIALSALGASAEATGDVDILQPIVVPLGEMTIRAEGLVGLLGDLEKAGLLTPQQREAGDAILQVYARPAGGPDRWETEIRFAVEGISVNGLPLQ